MAKFFDPYQDCFSISFKKKRRKLKGRKSQAGGRAPEALERKNHLLASDLMLLKEKKK